MSYFLRCFQRVGRVGLRAVVWLHFGFKSYHASFLRLLRDAASKMFGKNSYEHFAIVQP